ncbi:MAG: UDP-N-acetylmuramate dehydrogenase [Proteobacteria bacterium]|nr:UDP-N-acetylmuramate dehydrogenase [Pseudomonadota bacterium]
MDKIPPVRGLIEFDAPLSKYTWFRTGGKADILFAPEDKNDLCDFFKNVPIDIPVMPLGVGSNMLIREGGVEGIVIRFGKKFSKIVINGLDVRAEVGAPDIAVAKACLDAEISGLEFLRGIPGTIGGAVRMNAGAYQCEIKDIFKSATAVDRAGKVHLLNFDDMGFSYRHTTLPSDYILVDATFVGKGGEYKTIAKRMKEIGDAREESQPLRTRTGGSTFKNPAGKSAWRLIDEAGCRGVEIGGAKVSEKHCNFLINTGKATSSDIENLGEVVRERVLENSGFNLEWEIKRIGRLG